MPAGNYATAHAAVSCTGIGEDIIDECLRGLLCVTDGLSLQEAMKRSLYGSIPADLGEQLADSTGDLVGQP